MTGAHPPLYPAGMSDYTRTSDYEGLVLAGWIMAFLLPIGGLVACMVLDRRRPDHATGIFAVSALVLTLELAAAFLLVFAP